MQISLEQLAAQRGLHPSWLEWADIRIENGDVIIPYRNLTGVWYERTHRPHGTMNRYLSPKGAVSRLYNPAAVGPNVDILWIAEGEWDTLILLALGCDAIGIAGATQWKDIWAYLYEEARRTIVCTDPDQAGNEWYEKHGKSFRNPTRMLFPEGTEDINDWWLKDPANLEAVVTNLLDER